MLRESSFPHKERGFTGAPESALALVGEDESRLVRDVAAIRTELERHRQRSTTETRLLLNLNERARLDLVRKTADYEALQVRLDSLERERAAAAAAKAEEEEWVRVLPEPDPTDWSVVSIRCD